MQKQCLIYLWTNLLNQTSAGLWPTHAYFLKIDSVQKSVCVRACVCVCVHVFPQGYQKLVA